MHANVEEVLKNLGYSIDEKTGNQSNSGIINYSYKDLIELYSKLSSGDTAYIFDMLPEYAYLNNELEKEYIQSRITAMKNGAELRLFIIGDEQKLNRLKKNELYEYTVNSCTNDGKIYIIREEEIKEKCLDEFFQLAQGLYYGKRADGTQEAFRDLWTDNNGIGIMIKDETILKHIQNSVDIIFKNICSGEIEVETLFETK